MKRTKPRISSTHKSSSEFFTSEQIKADEYAKQFAWHHRKRPESFDAIQIRLGTESPICKWCDWWSSRSNFLCCIYPILQWIFGIAPLQNKDSVDAWKEQLQNPLNKKCPESMQGVWWLKCNHAPENLVTIFSDCEWNGTFNKEGTDGFGEWERRLNHNWSRDSALLGWIFMIWGVRKKSLFRGRMNLKDGICTIHGRKGEGIQVTYRINDDEWWKVHYNANPGEEGDRDVEFMYKWIKVLDKDANPTEHWEEYKEWTDERLPHQGCGCGDYKSCWWPFWGANLTSSQVNENMCRPNRRQLINFRV